MAGSNGIAAAFMTVALVLSCASANTLWMPVQVVDCENRPVVGAKVALWGCVDASGSSIVASSPQMSSVIATTGSDGYVIPTQNPVPAGGCAGLPTHFCYGSAANPCKMTVLESNLAININYTTEVLFSNYNGGVREYVVKYNPICKAKSGGIIDSCNNCGADQYCFGVTTTLRPSCCPRKCYCV